jgi:Holliday junction resolvase
MGAMSRNKGGVGEREVVSLVKKAGFPDAERTSNGRHQRTRGDIAGIPGVTLEVKRTERLHLRQAWAQCQEAAGDSLLPVLAHRWNGGEWLAIVPLDELLALVKHRGEA